MKNTRLSRLKMCKGCGKDKISISDITSSPEGRTYKCLPCENFWYVCETHNQRFAASQFSRMNHHFKSRHQSKSTACKDSFIPIESTNMIFPLVENKEYEKETTNEAIAILEQEKESIILPIQKELKEKNADEKRTEIAIIVDRAFCKSQHSPIICRHDESKFHIDVCDFMSKIPTTQHYQLLQILNIASIKYEALCYSDL